MYEGMSYIQLYKNRACTELVPQDVNGNYIFDIGVINNNIRNPFIFNLYAKNIGTHKAYEVNVTVVSGEATTSFIKCDIVPRQVKIIPFFIVIDKNQTIKSVTTFKLEFDSV